MKYLEMVYQSLFLEALRGHHALCLIACGFASMTACCVGDILVLELISSIPPQTHTFQCFVECSGQSEEKQ